MGWDEAEGWEWKVLGRMEAEICPPSESIREVTRRQSHGNEFEPYHKSQYRVLSSRVALMIILESRMG